MIRKAVIPVAGLGTRFLPATALIPKELLPIGARPSLDFIIEEAVQAGLGSIICVVSPAKRAMFDRYREYVSGLYPDSHMEFVVQDEAKGLGHAVLCAEHAVGNEEFMVFLPDDIIETGAEPKAAAQMIAVHDRFGKSVVALQDVARDQVSAYGIATGTVTAPRVYALDSLVEKPSVEAAPSTLAVVGRYLLSPRIFPALRKERKGRLGEIQLTDALCDLAKAGDLLGYTFSGRRFDVGNPVGMAIAALFYHRDYPEIRAMIRELGV